MNNGPYVDIDTQEYRPGPLAPKCGVCDLPLALCDCPMDTAITTVTSSTRCSLCSKPQWLCECEWLTAALRSELSDDTSAIVGWWPVAVFAILALAMGAAFAHGWWPL